MNATTTLITAFEKMFLIWTAVGLLAYFTKKYILIDGWNLKTFLSTALKPMLHATILTGLMGWFIPDLILLAPEKMQMTDIAVRYPRLVEKVTLTLGLVLGYTGGSVGFDLFALLYTIPIVGPFLQQVVEKLRIA